jgi:hypothetical protein
MGKGDQGRGHQARQLAASGVELINNGPSSGQPCVQGVDDFVELRTVCAIAVRKQVKAQNKKAFIVVLAISGKTIALTLKATVQYSRFSSRKIRSVWIKGHR